MDQRFEALVARSPTPRQAILKTLRDPLLSSSASLLASNMARLYSAEMSDDEAETVLCNLWLSLIGVVYNLPECVDGIAEALSTLKRQSIEPTRVIDGWHMWRDLPFFRMISRDMLADPTEEGFPDPLTSDLAAAWRGYNRLLAKLTADGFEPYNDIIPLSCLRDALESIPPDFGTQTKLAAETRVEVACYWLVMCGDYLSEHFVNETEVDPALVQAYAPGDLCGSSVPALGRERWDFWKERLGLIENKGLKVGEEWIKLGETIRENIRDARRVMVEVEVRKKLRGAR